MSIIRVENLGKRYLLSHQRKEPYFALRDVMAESLRRWGRKLVNPSFPDKTTSSKEEFWALKDVSFEVSQGEKVGIIGRNGAGKSTLLKILCRITEPTTGRAGIKGRVASLLEVGTGFHPELTGRENIYLNGAILGMTKSEIARKFDEIVDFAEVERFLDTPVKRYSSGMYVRLAFAVAAHLEPEILVVDEVLAVGDAQFQKKCLGKMADVSAKEGRTVLFVSHNMEAVRKLCDRGILLNSGSLVADDRVDVVLERYINGGFHDRAEFFIARQADPDMPGYAWKVTIEDLDGNQICQVKMGQPWQIRVAVKMLRRTEHLIIGVGMLTGLNAPLRTSWSKPETLEPGDYEVLFHENTLMLTAGTYPIIIGLSTFERAFQYVENAAFLSIAEVSDNLNILKVRDSGILLNPMTSETVKIA